MLGGEAVYDELPYFFTDQYDLGMEYIGMRPGRTTRWWSAATSQAASSSRSGCSDGRVVAGMNVNVWDVVDDIKELIRSGQTVDPARLADPDVPLASLTR